MSRKKNKQGQNTTIVNSGDTTTIQVPINPAKEQKKDQTTLQVNGKKPIWVVQEERRIAQKEQSIADVVKILKEDGALSARILALVQYDKKNPGVSIFLGEAKSKVLRNKENRVIRDSKGDVIIEWSVDAQTFDSISSAALVQWVGTYNKATKELSEIAEFIPGITKGVQFSEEKKQNQEEAQKINAQLREKLTEAANLSLELQKLGFGNSQNTQQRAKGQQQVASQQKKLEEKSPEIKDEGQVESDLSMQEKEKKVDKRKKEVASEDVIVA